MRELAGFYSRFVRDQKLAPVDVVGFSLGGWIAAEMAACNPEQFKRMVLVAPMGIRPQEGEMLDFFHMMAPRQLIATVLDPFNTPEFEELYGGIGPEQFEVWEDARAETARLAWVPFPAYSQPAPSFGTRGSARYTAYLGPRGHVCSAQRG
jgi:pimeloyl-ACP methyl ester carboxylesterase